MGLLVMILGLVLFLGVHTLTTQRGVRAQVIASAGKSGGSGWISSRYSMIASDCSSTSPVESASAGTRFCGLMARNSSLHCQPPLRVRCTDSRSCGSFFRLSAMRTR